MIENTLEQTDLSQASLNISVLLCFGIGITLIRSYKETKNYSNSKVEFYTACVFFAAGTFSAFLILIFHYNLFQEVLVTNTIYKN